MRRAVPPSLSPLLLVVIVLGVSACGGGPHIADASAVIGTGGASVAATASVGAGGGPSLGSGGDGGSGCAGSIDITDNGSPAHLTSGCGNPVTCTGSSTGPAAYEMGPFDGTDYYLCIAACADDGSDSQEVDLVIFGSTPGAYETKSFPSARLQYRVGAMYLEQVADIVDVQLSQVGAVGDLVAGTYTASIYEAGQMVLEHTLQGSFRVCRTPDQPGP